MTSVISSVFTAATGPKAIPKVDYSGNAPISNATLKSVIQGEQKVAASLAAMGPDAQSQQTRPKHSLFADAARAANPISMANLGAVALAGAGFPVLATMLSVGDTVLNFAHPGAKNFAPTQQRDSRIKPASKYGYFARADDGGTSPQANTYSPWADIVAPIVLKAAPATVPMGQKPKTPAPAPADEKVRSMLEGQMQEYNKIKDGIRRLVGGAHMNAGAEGMMTASTWARMDPDAMDQAVRNNGHVNLDQTGVSKELTDKLGQVDFKPTKVQQIALTLG